MAQATGHTGFERRLRRDIGKKSAAYDTYSDKLTRARRLQASLTSLHKNRTKKKYTATIERLLKEAGELRPGLISQIETLEARIREEMTFSEKEVTDFQKQYEKEHAEWVAAQKKQDVAAETLRVLKYGWAQSGKGMTPEDVKTMDAAKDKAAKSKIKAHTERKDVKKVQREIDSEARDKIFFTRHLQRIAAEKIALG